MAREFNASIDYLRNETAVVTAAPFTVAGWIRSTDAGNTQTFFSIMDAGFGGELWEFIAAGGAGGDPIRWIADGSTTATTSTSSGYSANTWHHVAAVEAASNDRRVYIDGGSKGTNSTNVTLSDLERTSFGRRDQAISGDPFSGRIAHFALWTVALTDAEVATLAAGFNPLRMRRESLQNYWPINGRSDEPDIIGGADMAVNGTPIAVEEPPKIYNSIVAP